MTNQKKNSKTRTQVDAFSGAEIKTTVTKLPSRKQRFYFSEINKIIYTTRKIKSHSESTHCRFCQKEKENYSHWKNCTDKRVKKIFDNEKLFLKFNNLNESSTTI